MDNPKATLGKLINVPLRDTWAHEEYDFTKWLSKKENLDLLSKEIGIEIQLLQTEAPVGKYSTDILAEDDRDNKIIIENQLEQTNHDHLGKLITYASGYDAKFIIWIVGEYKAEHERAVNWLNEHADDEINYFLVKVETWKIDESAIAPKFQVICKPNDWAKTVKSVGEAVELSEGKLLQLEYWNQFNDFASNRKTSLSLRTPRPRHWYDLSLGSSEAHITMTFNTV